MWLKKQRNQQLYDDFIWNQIVFMDIKWNYYFMSVLTCS